MAGQSPKPSPGSSTRATTSSTTTCPRSRKTSGGSTECGLAALSPPTLPLALGRLLQGRAHSAERIGDPPPATVEQILDFAFARAPDRQGRLLHTGTGCAQITQQEFTRALDLFRPAGRRVADKRAKLVAKIEED